MGNLAIIQIKSLLANFKSIIQMLLVHYYLQTNKINLFSLVNHFVYNNLIARMMVIDQFP